MKAYDFCSLCAHKCGVDRAAGELGICKMTSKAVVARAALHHWEEPPVSGTRGSGAIFFLGCSLGCVYCQNREISRGGRGTAVSTEELSEIMLRLEGEGAHNINFVTPTHFQPTVREAIILARARGLSLPIVYNTSSYDTPGSLAELSGLVDIYLPDLKYASRAAAARLSFAEDYPEVARRAIAEMVRQRPTPIIENGIMRSGVIVRILLLPGHTAEAKLSLKHIYTEYGDSVYISLMNQYTPMPGMKPPLDRRVTRAEYRDLLEYAERLGVRYGFTQDEGTAKESYIPSFDGTGTIQ